MSKARALHLKTFFSFSSVWITEISLALYIGGSVMEALWPGSVLFFLPLDLFFWVGSAGLFVTHFLKLPPLIYSSLVSRLGVIIGAGLFFFLFHPSDPEFAVFRILLFLGIVAVALIYLVGESDVDDHHEQAPS